MPPMIPAASQPPPPQRTSTIALSAALFTAAVLERTGAAVAGAMAVMARAVAVAPAIKACFMTYLLSACDARQDEQASPAVASGLRGSDPDEGVGAGPVRYLWHGNACHSVTYVTAWSVRATQRSRRAT